MSNYPKPENPAPSLEEAQARWKTHTQKLLTQGQKQDFRGKQWKLIDGYPAVVGKTLTIYFYKNDDGMTYGSFQVPFTNVGIFNQGE